MLVGGAMVNALAFSLNVGSVREGYIMVTCEVGQKRPAKMRIEGLQIHKRELFGPQRTVSDLVHDKAVDTPRPGFGSNKTF